MSATAPQFLIKIKHHRFQRCCLILIDPGVPVRVREQIPVNAEMLLLLRCQARHVQKKIRGEEEAELLVQKKDQARCVAAETFEHV
jgi:hypothetical protein